MKAARALRNSSSNANVPPVASVGTTKSASAGITVTHHQQAPAHEPPDRVAMMKSQVQEHAAGAIAGLAATNSDSLGGSCTPLVSLLRSDSPTTQEHACRALWHLAAENQHAIFAAGGIAPLVALARRRDAHSKEAAVVALRRLAGYGTHTANQAAITAAQRTQMISRGHRKSCLVS